MDWRWEDGLMEVYCVVVSTTTWTGMPVLGQEPAIPLMGHEEQHDEDETVEVELCSDELRLENLRRHCWVARTC